MFFNRINFRIGLWYSLAFLVSSFLLFVLTAFLLVESLKQKDRILLNEKTQEYSMIYERDGIKGLHGPKNFIIRLSDLNQKTLFIHSPDRSDDHNAPTIQDLDLALQKYTDRDQWFEVRGKEYGDHIEMLTRVLPSGEIIQVGKDTEDREAFLKSFTHAYFLGLTPIFILALVVGGFLSRRLLNPIRSLTQAVENIRSGNPKARVKLHENKDELWKLGTLFNQMLEQNEKLLQGMRDTVDNVAHDLRTPIMRLQNSVEGALSGKEEISKYREALSDCQENSEIIRKIVDAIMDISEASAGTLVLDKKPTDVAQIIESVVDLYGFVAEEKNIKIISKIENNFQLNIDRIRILQALCNLVDNAIKYSPQNTTVIIEAITKDGSGIIQVSDQGKAIAESERTRVWERLYRIDSSRSSRGLGLGLSLVKAMVNVHGGEVGSFMNNEGGNTFFIKMKI